MTISEGRTQSSSDANSVGSGEGFDLVVDDRDPSGVGSLDDLVLGSGSSSVDPSPVDDSALLDADSSDIVPLSADSLLENLVGTLSEPSVMDSAIGDTDFSNKAPLSADPLLENLVGTTSEPSVMDLSDVLDLDSPDIDPLSAGPLLENLPGAVSEPSVMGLPDNLSSALEGNRFPVSSMLGQVSVEHSPDGSVVDLVDSEVAPDVTPDQLSEVTVLGHAVLLHIVVDSATILSSEGLVRHLLDDNTSSDNLAAQLPQERQFSDEMSVDNSPVDGPGLGEFVSVEVLLKVDLGIMEGLLGELVGPQPVVHVLSELGLDLYGMDLVVADMDNLLGVLANDMSDSVVDVPHVLDGGLPVVEEGVHVLPDLGLLLLGELLDLEFSSDSSHDLGSQSGLGVDSTDNSLLGEPMAGDSAVVFLESVSDSTVHLLSGDGVTTFEPVVVVVLEDFHASVEDASGIELFANPLIVESESFPPLLETKGVSLAILVVRHNVPGGAISDGLAADDSLLGVDPLAGDLAALSLEHASDGSIDLHSVLEATMLKPSSVPGLVVSHVPGEDGGGKVSLGSPLVPVGDSLVPIHES